MSEYAISNFKELKSKIKGSGFVLPVYFYFGGGCHSLNFNYSASSLIFSNRRNYFCNNEMAYVHIL